MIVNHPAGVFFGYGVTNMDKHIGDRSRLYVYGLQIIAVFTVALGNTFKAASGWHNLPAGFTGSFNLPGSFTSGFIDAVNGQMQFAGKWY